MNVVRLIPILALATLFAPVQLSAQINHIYSPRPVLQNPVYQQPIYQQQIIQSPTHFVPGNPFDACDCGNNPGNPRDCKCKNLNCKITLCPGCKTVRPLHKTQINCNVFGKIPRHTIERNCLKKVCDFQYATEVPQVHCTREICVEIAKKALPCLPGCWFDVCVPAYECKTETVECKLVPKTMPMELWERRENGQVKYDVYVINNRDPNSPFHAGGMPSKWLILHCGSKAHLRLRFPGAICTDGKPFPFAKATRGAKPTATPADVNIQLIVDKKKIEAFKKQAAAEATRNSTKPQIKTAAKNETVAYKKS